MIKENQSFLNQLNIISDGVLVFLSMLISYWLRFELFSGIENVPFSAYCWLGAAGAVICLFSYALASLYESYRAIPFYKEAARFLVVNGLDALLLLACLFLFHLDNMSRGTIGFFYAVSSLLLLGKRWALRRLLRKYRGRGYNLKHVLIVGCGTLAETYLEKLRTDRSLGYQVQGYVCDAAGALAGVEYCGSYAQLGAALERMQPDEVVITLPSADEDKLVSVISACEKSGVKASVIPFYALLLPANPQIDNIDGLPMINIRRVPLDNIGNAFLKRTADIVGSLILIALTSPFMLLAVIGVKLSSSGPVIFSQERVGKGKRTFHMYKFRSMRVNNRAGVAWSTNRDDRRTKFGSFIRKYSIDELPQLFNVLKGDMSLVGPRPEIPFFVEKFKEEIPKYMIKHQVRPGITGWAQVNGYRGDTSIEKRIEHDLYYIENWNPVFDIKILFMTLFKFVNTEEFG